MGRVEREWRNDREGKIKAETTERVGVGRGGRECKGRNEGPMNDRAMYSEVTIRLVSRAGQEKGGNAVPWTTK